VAIAFSGASIARIGRFVVPDLPHHVTQRGNRREKVFFGDDDYALYRDLLHEAKGTGTDMLGLTPPHHTPTLPAPVVPFAHGSFHPLGQPYCDPICVRSVHWVCQQCA